MRIFFLFCFTIASVLSGAAQRATQRPNIIYIYADDLGYGELGSYGQEKIKTPNLDRMAREGMRFTQHYSGAPVCAPSRCMLMTGKHSGHSYIRGNYGLGSGRDSEERGQMPLPENTFTIAGMLRQRGYRSGVIGKWSLGFHDNSGNPLKQGFDYQYGFLDQSNAHNHYPTHQWENGRYDSLDNPAFWVHSSIDAKTATDADFAKFSGNDYAAAKVTEKAVKFIEREKRGPFFLYIPYTLPHLALQAPEDYMKRYIGQFSEQPYYGNTGYSPSKHPRSTYAAMITYLDDQVGIILAAIRKLGLDKNTLVMFSSDNGTSAGPIVDAKYFNSTAGLRGVKKSLYEGGYRVPFIARWPGKVPANTVNNHVSAQFDIMQTLAELTGRKIGNTDGVSLLPTLTGRNASQEKHPHLYFEFAEGSGQVAVRLGDWKGIRKDMKADPNAPWELYDLATDVSEKNNVAAAHPDIIARMADIARKEHVHPHILEWEFIDPIVKK